MTPDLTLCFCTFRRNDLLTRALDSVIVAERPDGLVFDVVVVDNSDEGAAAPVIAAAAARAPFHIAGVAAHPANIAAARNAGLAAARGAWLAFLDDDQELAPDWLTAFARFQANPGCDVAFGRVTARFEPGAAVTTAARRIFSRECDLPEGAALFASGPDKTKAFALGAGNSLMSRAALEGWTFDPAFGRAGGEDCDIFTRMQNEGLRFAWRPSLQVFEFVPASRCDPAYLRRRMFTGGQVYAETAARLSRAPQLARWGLRAKAVAQAAALAPRGALAFARGGAAREEFGYKLAGVAGKLSLSSLYELYAEPAKPAAQTGAAKPRLSAPQLTEI